MNDEPKYLHLNVYGGDRPLMYFSLDSITLTIQSNERNDFYLYTNLKINKGETMIRSSDTQLSDFDGISNQPEYAFYLFNDIDEISLNQNCGQTRLTLNSNGNYKPKIWIDIEDKDICKRMYYELRILDMGLKKISIDNVLFRPVNSWVWYTATKTIYTRCKDYIDI